MELPVTAPAAQKLKTLSVRWLSSRGYDVEVLRGFAAAATTDAGEPALAVPVGDERWKRATAAAAGPLSPSTLAKGAAGLVKVALGVDAAPDELVRQRLARCRGDGSTPACRHLGAFLRQERCGLCFCFIKAKAQLASEQCPAGEWPGETPVAQPAARSVAAGGGGGCRTCNS